jgi:hypothetical protein
MEPSEAALNAKKAPSLLLPLAYFPPVPYFKLMLSYEQTVFDLHEHFHKQFYYNRCQIYSPNGILKLTIPILHRHKRSSIKEVRISYEHDWRTIHWRSLQAAYRRSPYFEFYEHYFTPLFTDFKPEFLSEWNVKLFETINIILGNKLNFSFTSKYSESYENTEDRRLLAAPAELAKFSMDSKRYTQVFEEKHGFIGNLSIIDLLFCEGPQSLEYLKN